jgi:hypothetical protein
MDIQGSKVSRDLKAMVKSVVAGDVAGITDLLAVPQSRLLDEVRNVELVLDRESLARVLHRLEDHQIDPTQVQRWASFVRRGYFSGQSGERIKPIMIEYEQSYEDEIADIVSRLDEIGDVIDGAPLNDEEIFAYLARLGLTDVN